MAKDSNKYLRISIEDIQGYIEYLTEKKKRGLLDSEQNTQQKEQSYKKENIIQYVEKALLDDKIDFRNENKRHSNYIEQEVLKNLGNKKREYVKPTDAHRTYYIMCEDSSCFEAHEKKYTYDPNDNTCYTLENIAGEELCTFYDFKSYSEKLGQSLSVIDINGNKALCLRTDNFYPYEYISYRMRIKIGFALNRLIKRNPNLVNDIITDISNSQPTQDQMKLLFEINQNKRVTT